MASSYGSGLSPAAIDDYFGYTSMSIEQKQDLPNILSARPSVSDCIDRISFADVIAIVIAEYVSNLKRAFPYVFVLIFEK